MRVTWIQSVAVQLAHADGGGRKKKRKKREKRESESGGKKSEENVHTNDKIDAKKNIVVNI